MRWRNRIKNRLDYHWEEISNLSDQGLDFSKRIEALEQRLSFVSNSLNVRRVNDREKLEKRIETLEKRQGYVAKVDADGLFEGSDLASTDVGSDRVQNAADSPLLRGGSLNSEKSAGVIPPVDTTESTITAPLIYELLVEEYGDMCETLEDFDENCSGCKIWAEYNKLVNDG